MKNKFPNASILTLITQKSKEIENLLFIYLNTIPDFYPSNKVHWYDGAGINGIPNNVWNKLSIRQWTVCGKDSVINNLFDDIIATKKLAIKDKEITLIIPTYILLSNEADFTWSRRDVVIECLKTENNTLIPQEFYQKENLQLLSSYQILTSEIKPFLPLGFFEENFLYNNLKKNIWGVRAYRTPYLTFKGIRENPQNNECREMIGFYQQNFDFKSYYTVQAQNESSEIIGKTSINKKTGFFKLELSENTQKGKVVIFRDNQKEKERKFDLLVDININIKSRIAKSRLEDKYGKSHLITSKHKPIPEKLANYTWQQRIYADKEIGNKKLSELFKSIFEFLGPKILVVDPYFIGNIKQDTTTSSLELSNCQTSLINALFHSTIEEKVTQLTVLGCSRITKQIEIDETDGLTKVELLMENYERYFRDTISNSKLEKYFPDSTLLFKRAKENFHNRYWFSLKYINGIEILDKCVILTNSFGDMLELDIIPILDQSQLKQIRSEYTRIFKTSVQLLSI